MNTILKRIALISLMFCQTAYANLLISPTQMYLNEKGRQRSATVVMEAQNIASQKIFEMYAYKWIQNERGEDVLELDNNILLNPKNFVIKPNSKQIVRVGFSQPLNTMDLSQEKTWRIVFKEVESVSEENTLQFLFNISVPLFVGKQAPIEVLATSIYRDNRLFINIQNNAKSHLQINSIKIIDKHKKEVASSNEMKYLLLQQKYSFDMGNVKLGNIQDYTLKLITDKREQEIELKMKG